MLPVSELAAPIRGPMYSGYAKVLHDGDRLRRHVIDGLSLTLMIITPLSVGIALTANLIEQVALGPEWAGASAFIQVCAFYALFEGVGEFTHGLYIVKDRQRRFVGIMSVTVFIRVILVLTAGFKYGTVAAAGTFAFTSFFSSAIWLQQLAVIIHLSMKSLFLAVWRVGVATAVMSAGVRYFLALWGNGEDFFSRVFALIFAVALGGILYIGTLLGLWLFSGRPEGPENHAAEAIPKLLARLGIGSKIPSLAQ
jgi:PST family polysaccharide transporter